MTGRIGILCVAALLGVSCSASQPKVPQQTDVSPLAQSQAPSSAVQHLRALAEQGNAEAQFNLGQLYEHGRGVPKDYAEALRWYRLAAEQGDPFAQFDLGSHYSEGIGVPKDEKEALRWWQSAAAQGFPPAQHSLGKVLARGEQGVLPDKVQAYVWFALSAAQGNEEARQERDALAKQLTPAQVTKAKQLIKQWKPVNTVVTKRPQ